MGYASSVVRIASAARSDSGNPAAAPLVLLPERIARGEAVVEQEQRRQDDSGGLDFGETVAEILFEVGAPVLEAAGDVAGTALEVVLKLSMTKPLPAVVGAAAPPVRKRIESTGRVGLPSQSRK